MADQTAVTASSLLTRSLVCASASALSFPQAAPFLVSSPLLSTLTSPPSAPARASVTLAPPAVSAGAALSSFALTAVASAALTTPLRPSSVSRSCAPTHQNFSLSDRPTGQFFNIYLGFFSATTSVVFSARQKTDLLQRQVKSIEFLKERVRVDTRKPEKCGKGPLRFWDHRIAIFHSEETGNGLLATEFIPAGTLIWSADLNQESSDILTLDEVLSFDTATQRQMWADYTWAISGLFFGPRRDLPLQQAVSLEASHFLNHSCEANVGFVSDTSLMTIRDIEPNTMISNDYALTEHLIGFFPGFECRCGSARCRELVTVNDWRIPELQERYRGFFTSAVEQLIRTETTDWTPFLQKEPAFSELRIGIELKPHPVAGVGKGLFATERIRKGDMICVDQGKGKTISVADVLAVTDPRIRAFYIRFGWQTGREEFTVPTVDPLGDEEPDAGYFMNHSCDPTAVAFGKLYIAFRDIEPGEEITYDYATTETQFDRIPECKCGTARCRGSITAEDWKLPELQYRYPPLAWSTHVVMQMFGRFGNA